MKKVYRILITILIILGLLLTLNINKVVAESLLDAILDSFNGTNNFSGESFVDEITIATGTYERPEEGIFCIDQGTPIWPGIYQREGCNIIPSNQNKIAYIMLNADATDKREDGVSYNVRQEAIWSVLNGETKKGEDYPSQISGNPNIYYRCVGLDWWQGGQNPITKITEDAPQFVKLYKEAVAYDQFINNIDDNNFSVDKDKGEIQSNNNYIYIVGPYNISFTSNDKVVSTKTFKQGSINVDISETSDATGVWASDKEGKIQAIESGEDFYISINKINIDKSKESKISITYQYDKYTIVDACKYIRTKDLAGNDVNIESQILGSFDAKKETITVPLELTVPKLIPPIKISFKKVDTSNQKMYSTFKMEVLTEDKTVLKTIDSILNADTYEFEYQPESFDKFYTYIYENVPNGYGLVETIGEKVLAILLWEFDNASGKLVCKNIDYGYAGNWDTKEATRTDYTFFLGNARNFAKIDKITLLKKDFLTEIPLENVKFSVKIENVESINGANIIGNKYVGTITTTSEGLVIEDVLIAKLNEPIKITLTETGGIPTGYKKINGDMVIEITRNNSVDNENKTNTYTYGITCNKEDDELRKSGIVYYEGDNSFIINVNNIPTMGFGGKVWVDDFNGNYKTGAKRNGTFDPGEGLAGVSVKLYKISFGAEVRVEKDEDGNALQEVTGEGGSYRFENIIKGKYKVVFEYDGIEYITLKEDELSQTEKDKTGKYIALEKGREIFNQKLSVVSDDIAKENIATETYGIAKARVEGISDNLRAKIGEIKTIFDNLSVTRDEILDVVPDGLEDVITTLFPEIDGGFDISKLNFSLISEDKKEQLKANTASTIMSIIERPVRLIIQSKEDLSDELLQYMIECMLDGTFSDLIDVIADDGTELIYDTTDDVTNKSKLKTKSYIKAESGYVNEENYTDIWATWSDDGLGTFDDDSDYLKIDCALKRQVFDLSLGTEVDNARVEINGKSTTYTYDEILQQNAKYALENDGSNDNKYLKFYYGELNTQDTNTLVDYNLYLYESDYKYRIGDYTDKITNKINPLEESESTALKNSAEELEVYITYKIKIFNQSVEKANVDVETVADYFDPTYYTYDSVEAKTASGIGINTIVSNASTVTIGGKEYEKRTISLASNNRLGNKDTEESEPITIYVTLKVKKDANGVILRDKENIAEITQYRTSEGLIDIDSAPENCIIKGKLHYEDDTDEAETIDVQKKTVKLREISGYVWDDGEFSGDYWDNYKNIYVKSSDGKLDDTEKKVNDVIVQLIEIKDLEVNGKKYQLEYIWQETRSGPGNKIRKLNDNGIGVTENSTETKMEEGQYKFTGFIPGNYIVRFIYGDGSTYDLTDSVKKYNGVDYKSTIDPYYTSEWYNDAGYSDNSSVARDNEARRLKVMSYTAVMDVAKSKAIKEKSQEMLKASWMCAETSKINILVDDNDKTNIKNTNTDTASNLLESNIFTNINFGLALRVETGLTLEKHITALKLKSNNASASPIVDARLSNDGKRIEGIKDGLTTNKSTRNDRGFWKIETDLEELAQGAQLEATYTYTVSVKGKKDYLSKLLIDKYNEYLNNPETAEANYKAYLEELEVTVKNNIKAKSHSLGTYLGTSYYKGGTPGINEEQVEIQVKTIEEALNNDMIFNANAAEASDFKVTGKNVPKTVWKKSSIDTITNQEQNINNVVTTKTPIGSLASGESDSSKQLVVSTTLNASSEGVNIPSYIAEITSYSSPTGVVSSNSLPGNLAYVHSEDQEMTMIRDNELDEFWGESVIITKPTGEDKITTVQLIAIISSALILVGTGIILIKKFVIVKK